MTPNNNNQEGMDEAEAFIRQQMTRNDEKLKEVTGIDCAGFAVLKDGMLLQHDTDRYLLGSARATRRAVADMSDKLDDTHTTVKLLVDEVRKSNGNGNSSKNGKTLATWKLPLIGEVALRGFRANDIILIVLCIGLIVVGVKAWENKGSPNDTKNQTSEEVQHGSSEKTQID